MGRNKESCNYLLFLLISILRIPEGYSKKANTAKLIEEIIFFPINVFVQFIDNTKSDSTFFSTGLFHIIDFCISPY
jgi:hypothetical protein